MNDCLKDDNLAFCSVFEPKLPNRKMLQNKQLQNYGVLTFLTGEFARQSCQRVRSRNLIV